MNSIISSQSAERAPDSKDWAQSLKNFIKSQEVISFNEIIIKGLGKRITVNEETIEKLKEVIKKLELKNVQKVVTENAGPFVSSTIDKPKWDDKTSAPKMKE